MAQLRVLGSANAIPTKGKKTSSLLICTGDRLVVVDCGTNPVPVFSSISLDLHQISDLILTHFHPDHVAATPLFLMDLWLLGRKEPLNIHGFDFTLDRFNTMMDLFEWQTWPDYYEMRMKRLPEQVLVPVVTYPDLRITGSPVKHMIPTLGLRFENPDSGKGIAYSCDTEPCEEVVEMAQGCMMLIHETAGESRGHTSARQAGEIASQAGVETLCLIHYPSHRDKDDLVREAQKTFSGKVIAAEDGMVFDF